MTGNLTIAQKYDLQTRAWQMSLDGVSSQRIAAELGIDGKTVRRMLHKAEKEIGELRISSGEAEASLNQYIGNMRQSRLRATSVYHRTLRRLDREEQLELVHEQERARPSEEYPQGRVPTTAVTRALEFHMHGLPVALKAIDTAVATTQAEGRVLGLEALGKEEAQRQLQEKLAGFLTLLNTPMEITIKTPGPTPDGWDEPDEDDEFE